MSLSRADRLIRDARQVAGEMQRALDHAAWNLATRRAHESVELAIAALLTEVGVDPAATPEPVPQLRQGLRELGHDVDANALASLQTFSEELAGISDLAFNQEIVVTDGQARDWGQRGQDALQFVEDLLARVRRGIGERRP